MLKAGWEIAEEVLEEVEELPYTLLTGRVLLSQKSRLGWRGGATPSQTLRVELSRKRDVFYSPRRGVYALRKRVLRVRVHHPGIRWHGACQKITDFLAQEDEGNVYWIAARILAYKGDRTVCELDVTTRVDVPRWRYHLERTFNEFLARNRLNAEAQLVYGGNATLART